MNRDVIGLYVSIPLLRSCMYDATALLVWQKKQQVGDGSSAAQNKYYSSSNTDSDATLYSSSSNKPDGSANETDDADESDMDLSNDNPHRDDDAVRAYDNQDPPNNREGENKKKRRKDVGEPSSRSSRQNRSLVVIVQDDTPALQPLDQADILIQKHSKPECFPKKSGTDPRRTMLFNSRSRGADRIRTTKVRRSDDKEYEFSYVDLPRLSVNDVEDIYLLQV
ncbi:hypothetical protein Tco_0441543 [Tanacetum coccineum]